jgi:kynureninase
MDDDLLQWRSEFPILAQTVYLISHSLGAMPNRTRRRLEEYADVWASRGIRAWEEGWWNMPVTTGNLIGCIIGAGDGEVTMHQNVTICQAIVHSCFDWTERRNRIVTEDLNFPTNLYLFQGLERQGARIITVPSQDGISVPLERMLAAIDDQTRLVSLSHVLFRSAAIQDVAAIAARAHEVGAYVMADLYQSAGTVPVNVKDWGVDFATGGSVKWLCGGPGAAYLSIRRDLWPKLQPAFTGWAAHEEPFAFDARMRYAEDALRFTTGTPNVPGMYAAQSGYEIVNEIGVKAIRTKSQRQTGRLIDLADEAGFAVNCPRDAALRGGSVIIDVPGGKSIVAELARRNILVDYRPGAGIRIAPHFYSTDEELEIAMREIRSLVQ